MRQMKKTPMQSGRRDIVYHDDDFLTYTDAEVWDGSATQGGDVPALQADIIDGVIDMDAGATADNNISCLETTHEEFIFEDKKPLGFEWFGYYGETTGDTANVFVGFMDALSTTPFQDDGAGPKPDFCGFGFYRLDGGVVWNTIVDNLTNFAQLTQALTLANTRNLAGHKIDADEDVWYRLRAECNPVCLKTAAILNLDFDFWVNDIHVVHENADMTIANFSNMNYGMALHAGENAATLLACDYTSFAQMRHNIPGDAAP